VSNWLFLVPPSNGGDDPGNAEDPTPAVRPQESPEPSLKVWWDVLADGRDRLPDNVNYLGKAGSLQQYHDGQQAFKTLPIRQGFHRFPHDGGHLSIRQKKRRQL